MAGLAHGIEQGARRLAPAGDEHEGRRWERVGEIVDQKSDVLGREATDRPRHDDPLVPEEGRRLGGLDDGRHLIVVAVQLLDGEGGVVVPDEGPDQLAYGISGEDAVVTLDVVHGQVGGRRHGHP